MSDSHSSTGYLLRLAGARHWTASVLPALMGTLLPFWLSPPGFSFRWSGAVAFGAATLLVHTGFSFLKVWIDAGVGGRPVFSLVTAIVTLMAGCIIGVFLNARLSLQAGVFPGIFVLYGLAVFFVGILYIIPPFRFARRPGGEVVLAQGMGLMPVLGAYLVQVGDITRTVYLASMPVVVATGVWIWVEELATRGEIEAEGRSTMVGLFSRRFSRRYVTLILVLACYLSLGAAMIVRRSLPLSSLLALLSLPPAAAVLRACWGGDESEKPAGRVRSHAALMHALVCAGLIIALAITAATGWKR